MKRPLPDGTTHLLFTGLELLRRVASLVPPPRVNLTRFHGVFAPGAIRPAPVRGPSAPALPLHTASLLPIRRLSSPSRPARASWPSACPSPSHPPTSEDARTLTAARGTPHIRGEFNRIPLVPRSLLRGHRPFEFEYRKHAFEAAPNDFLEFCGQAIGSTKPGHVVSQILGDKQEPLQMIQPAQCCERHPGSGRPLHDPQSSPHMSKRTLHVVVGGPRQRSAKPGMKFVPDEPKERLP
ncbi:hypothetical protein F0U63_20990 [Cystobacter fuscus]|nr:hypothetical protein F0U63_20990 [Cystobacter fuscus]